MARAQEENAPGLGHRRQVFAPLGAGTMAVVRQAGHADPLGFRGLVVVLCVRVGLVPVIGAHGGVWSCLAGALPALAVLVAARHRAAVWPVRP